MFLTLPARQEVEVLPGKAPTFNWGLAKPLVISWAEIKVSIEACVPVAVPVPHDSVVVDTFWRNVDTAAILRRFFTQYTYQDTIRDSSFVAILREVLAQNQIIERQLSVQNLRPTQVTYTTTVETPPPRWYAGGFASYGGHSSAGVTLLYARKNNAFGITADPFTRSAGVQWLHAIR